MFVMENKEQKKCDHEYTSEKVRINKYLEGLVIYCKKCGEHERLY